MTIIKSTEIPYLKKEVLELYNNVTVIGADGGCIKMNSLLLCAVSQFLKSAFHEENEEHTIVTEFSFEELKQMKEYCIKGSCNVTAESILQAFGLLKEVKIRLDCDEFKNDSKPPSTKHDTGTNSYHDPTPKIEVSENSLMDEEFFDMKDEPLSDMEFDFENYSDNTTNLPAALTILKSPKRKQNFVLKAEDDDEDWEPKRNNSNNKTKYSDSDRSNIYRQSSRYSPHKRGPKSKLTESDLALYKTFDLPKSLEDYKAQARNNRNFLGISMEKNINDPTLNIKCDQCEKKFKIQHSLNQHVIKHHNEHLECPFCLYAYYLEDAEEFKFHIFTHMSGKYRIKVKHAKMCIQCGDFSNPIKHAKDKGPFHNDECSQCFEKMTSYQEYCNHVKIKHSGIWKYRCGHCEDLFDENEELLKHSESFHPKKTQKTRKIVTEEERKIKEKEGKIYDSKRGQWIKPWVPKGMKKYPGFCDLCAKMSQDIEYHMYYQHHTDPVQCNECKKTFKNRETLWGHQEIHKLQPCSICGKMIKKPKMTYHIRSNHMSNEEKPYRCDVCGKGFVSRNTLDEHNNIHTGAKPFKCKYCPSAFASRGTHAMHQKGHLGIKRKFKNK